MDQLKLLTVLCVLVFFGFIVYLMISHEKKELAKKVQIALALGFSKVEPDQALLDQITRAYPHPKTNVRYELKNVFRKIIADGEVVIFDLNNTASEEDGQVENQAVAIISPRLNLPHFVIHPLADTEGWATNLANRVMRMAVARSGVLVEFPESADFHKKYLLTSLDPSAAQHFFEPQMLHHLAQTHLLNINANENIFTLTSIDPTRKSFDQQSMADRINQAMQIFQILQQGN